MTVGKDNLNAQVEQAKLVAAIDATLQAIQTITNGTFEAEHHTVVLDKLGAKALALLPKDIIGISFINAGITYEVMRPETEYSDIPEEQRGVWQLWQLDRFAQTKSPISRRPMFLPPEVK